MSLTVSYTFCPIPVKLSSNVPEFPPVLSGYGTFVPIVSIVVPEVIPNSDPGSESPESVFDTASFALVTSPEVSPVIPERSELAEFLTELTAFDTAVLALVVIPEIPDVMAFLAFETMPDAELFAELIALLALLDLPDAELLINELAFDAADFTEDTAFDAELFADETVLDTVDLAELIALLALETTFDALLFAELIALLALVVIPDTAFDTALLALVVILETLSFILPIMLMLSPFNDE